ncbi:glutathione S-transferase [Aliihoeflea aestuarii]|jgi:glutathione S-transferase|uniref:glutathione S-transferase family protein n=1 Tax=Aliihoeflea aestuarii TaxID=453840 RepID=UPI0020926B29|nr:glutathione S-transferase family protein [Aliihoeflea aestuarii]MCO6389478.1 glutathione S-transferase [Aliihoeflea aestuarii]
MSDRLKFFYNPKSRASTVRWMLEEVEADYEIVHVDFGPNGERDPRLVAVNPMGKVPTIVLPDGTVLTESAAICAWLADAYPDTGLAPAPGSPERGTYYRWLFFGGSVFEPALLEKMMRKDAEPLPKVSVGWGSYDDALRTVETGLAGRTYLVGDRFSAADVYMGAMLAWTMSFGAPGLKESNAISAYVARLTERPAFKRAIQF